MAVFKLAERSAPSWNKTMAGSVDLRPALLPSPSAAAQSPDLNPREVAASVVNAFSRALASENFGAASSLFVENGIWRDHLVLSWDFRTVQSPPAIADFLKQRATSDGGLPLKTLVLDESSARRMPALIPLGAEGLKAVQIFLHFETAVGTGRGLARLVHSDGQWKIYTLHTTLQGLKGHEERLGERRPHGVEHGAQEGRKNWAERRQAEVDFQDGTEPSVLVLGAGQAGLTIAARLKMLGVNALVIDKNDRVGDNWRKRYRQLVLHDPVWYDHLPYAPFPPHWPIFTPKDKLAQWFEAYVNTMELNVWTKTHMDSSKYDDAKGEWTVTLTRRREDGSTESRTVRPRHIVQATGQSGEKNMPKIEGIDSFKGDLLCHSSEFEGAKPASQGKKAVIVGSCNSAMDIAQDMSEKGYDVTLVQRSSTHIVSSEAIRKFVMEGIYSENAPATEDADLMVQALPMALLKALHIQVVKLQQEHDREMLDSLTQAGFRLDSGPDDSGLFFCYIQGGGGYYIDVGSSKLVGDGRVKVKQGVGVSQVLPHGLRFSDGSELEADEIVFATGYQNMRMTTRAIFGNETADRIGDVWGLNEEGEFRAIWQRSGHPGLWMHGGNLAFCRHYSRLLALQIKGLEAGLYKYDEK